MGSVREGDQSEVEPGSLWLTLKTVVISKPYYYMVGNQLQLKLKLNNNLVPFSNCSLFL